MFTARELAVLIFDSDIGKCLPAVCKANILTVLIFARVDFRQVYFFSVILQHKVPGYLLIFYSDLFGSVCRLPAMQEIKFSLCLQ